MKKLLLKSLLFIIPLDVFFVYMEVNLAKIQNSYSFIFQQFAEIYNFIKELTPLSENDVTPEQAMEAYGNLTNATLREELVEKDSAKLNACFRQSLHILTDTYLQLHYLQWSNKPLLPLYVLVIFLTYEAPSNDVTHWLGLNHKAL